MDNQLQIYNKPGLFEAMEDSQEQSYAEGKPSQSHFYAGKLLRSRCLRAISGAPDVRFA